MGRVKKKVDLTANKGRKRDPTSGEILPKAVVLNRIIARTYPQLEDGKVKKMGWVNACKAEGYNVRTITYWLNEDPELKQLVIDSREAIKEDAREMAKQNIYDAINGEVKLRPKERIEVSKWLLEKTDEGFNPKLQLETKNVNVDVNMSSYELEAYLNSLLTEK